MKKFYILTIIFALLGISQVWANSAKKEEGTWEGNREWSGNHAAFRIDGSNKKDGRHLDITENSEQTVSWTVDEGCTINVTTLRFRMGYNGWLTGKCDITINNVYQETTGTTTGSNKEYNGYNLGNDDTFKLLFSKQIDLYWIEVYYTITPNDAPAVAEPASVTIPVSLSDDHKNVDLSQVFTLAAGVPSDFAIEYNKDGGVIDGSNFYAEAAGEYTLNARVAAKENDHEVSAWSGDYVITVERRNPTLTLTVTETAVQVEKTLDLSALIVEHVGHALEYSVTSDNKDKATLNGAEFSATEAGVYTVLIKSIEGDQYNETSQIVTVTVNAKPTPSFVRNFTQEEADALLVEGAIENAFTLTNVSDDENLAINVLTKTISDVKKGSEVLSYDKATNTITALNAGTATIQFVQTETEEIGGASSEVFTFTVSKHDNTLYVKGVADFAATIQPDAVLEGVVFTADNTDYANSPINWAVKEGAEFAEFDEVNNIITANYKLGTASWTLTQEESYKYEAAETTFSVTVASGEAISSDDCLVVDTVQTDGKGKNAWALYTVANGPAIPLHGPGDQLTFWGSKSILTVGGEVSIQYATDGKGGNFKDIEGITMPVMTETWTKYGPYTLPEGTTHIRFITTLGATNWKYYGDIKVTRKAVIDAENVELDVLVTKEGNGTLSFDYSVVSGGDLKIVCDNDKFTLDTYKVENDGCIGGTANIPFTFAAQDATGVHTANITIYNDILYKQLTITANVRKITPTVTAPEAKELTYSGFAQDLVDAATTDGGTLLYRIGEGEWSAAVPQATNAGEYVVWYKVEGNEIYDDVAEASVNVTIAKATPEITTKPQAADIKLGQTLSESVLYGGEANVDGTFAWQDDSIEPDSAVTYQFNVVFTPNDTENYNPVVFEVDVKVTDTGTDVDNTKSEVKATKILRNGQVFILRDGKVYNIQGMEVR